MAARLGSGGRMPEAVVCANDPMAIGVLQALHASWHRRARTDQR